MPTLHVLRVFTADDGSGGNPLGVFLDGAAVAPADRLGVARELGFSETVFVEDAARGVVAIFTPAAELPFAGHPLVGTAWLLAREREPVEVLRPRAGEVPVRVEGELVWIAGRPEWAPEFEWIELAPPEAVDALDGPPAGDGLVGAWAWEDEAAGAIRARVFPLELGIAEDEATGAAAVRLAASLDRPIVIRQGRGSVLLARPAAAGFVEVGGRTTLIEVREL